MQDAVEARGLSAGEQSKVVERGLEEIALLLGFSDKGRFKAQAYERGAEVVGALSFELGAVIERGRLTDIEGIGASLSKQILELWSTGSSALLEKLRAENPPGAAELVRIPGVTPKRVHALHAGLGIASVADLRAACEAGRVRGLSGFGAKTEAKLLAAIDAVTQAERGEPRMTLGDALSLCARWQSELLTLPGVEAVELAGPARRGEETLDELALVVVHAGAQLVHAVEERADVVHAELAGDVLRAARIDGIPMRLYLTDSANAGTTLLRATGPEAHLRELEARAPLSARASEQDVYVELGLPLVPPELRDAPIDATQTYDDLITAADIRGFVHCHTTHSDGKHSIEEMARAAKERGMDYITITDHSPSAYYARGVTLDRLQAQWDEMREAEQRVGIRILRGTESDILADGALDYPDEILAQLDVVIASIHSRFKLGKAEMTERLVRAMKLPVFKIWGHALGRLLLSRAPIECDVEAVLDALASSRGAIEINGDPHRLDLPPQWIRPARERGIPFVLSVDAHSTKGLDVLPFAAQMGRRGGLRKSEVLNTLDADAFVQRVRPSP
ncbi:MAG: PHP domain-containing protein [Polyangiales bacterium]